MSIFGVHAFVWNGDWNNEIAPDTIRQSAEAGYDLLEIPMLHFEKFDGVMMRRLLEKHKIRGVTSIALPKKHHLPFDPDGALTLLKAAVDKTVEIGSESMGGCPYCNLGTLTVGPPTQGERDTVARVIGEVARYAKERGIRIGIEPVNRYETYLYNVGSDTADLIHKIGADNLFIHFDTYHMHIEEHGIGAAIKQAGPLCGYIHLSESDRGIPGLGNMNWDDTFSGLKAIDFKGPMVLEAFAAINPEIAGATCLWRPGTYTPLELATQGLAFLKSKAAEAGLN